MATGAPADAAAEQLARGEASQAEALPAQVRLVGVPYVNRQSRHAVRITSARGGGASLSQREEALEPQRPLEDLRTHPHWIQTVRTTPANPGIGGRST